MLPVAPETEAREAILKALEETYTGLGFLFRKDKLHKSLGDNGTVIAVYPRRTRHNSRVALISEMTLIIQFYGAYKKEVNREETVDPAVVESYAEMMRQKFKTTIDVKSNHNWYFMVEDVEYPEDPTGNLTRYEALIMARGANTALQETH